MNRSAQADLPVIQPTFDHSDVLLSLSAASLDADREVRACSRNTKMVSILSRLADRDARRGVKIIQALAATAEDSFSFVHHVLNQLAEEIGSDLTTLSVCDLQEGTRRVVGRPGEALSARERATFDRHFREHPLVRFHAARQHGPAQRISDCTTQQAFQHSPVFADYYRPLGIRYVLALPLRIDPTNVISIVFNRSSSNFQDSERALLEAIRGPLATLYSNVITREQASAGLASLQDLAASGGWHVVRLGQDGRPIEVSQQACDLIRRFFYGAWAGPGADLPDAIADWLRRNRNWGLDRLASQSRTQLTISRNGAKLSLRFVCDPLLVQGGGFLLMKREGAQIGAKDLASLPLTRREQEVLRLVISGKTNAEIATLLMISARTVQKHLEHIFIKLGVETRTAAAVCALAAADGPGPST